MIKIALCDDDKDFISMFTKILKKVFTDRNQKVDYHIFHDSQELMDSKISADILFLDIDMPNISGIEVANMLRKENNNIILIFVTWYEDLVYGTLKYNPFRFLRKKFINEEIAEIADSLIIEINKINDFYLIKFNGKFQQVKLIDITFFEVFNHQVILHRLNDEISVNLSLSKIEKDLCNKGFIRIHNSYLVNYLYIFSIEKSEVILSTDKVLLMSKHRASFVKERLQYFERYI